MPIKDRISCLSLAACFAILIFLLFLYLPPSMHWPVFHDGPIMQYIAQRILAGAAPYRDLFDMNMPGVYLLHMLSLQLGDNDISFRLFDLLTGIFIAAALVACAWPSVLCGAVATLFLLVLHLINGPAFSWQRDFMLLPFLLWAGFCLKRMLENPGRWCSAFLYGLLVSYAFWIKPIIAAFIVMSIGAVLCQSWPQRRKLTAICIMACGAAIPTAAIHLWLYEASGLAAFYDIFLHFDLPLYSGMHPFNWRTDMWSNTRFCLPVMGVLLYLLWRRSRDTPAKITVTLMMVYGLIHYYGQGKGWFYHLSPLWASGAFYLAAALPTIRFSNAPAQVTFYAGLVALSVYLLPWFYSPSYFTPENTGFNAAYIASVKADVRQAMLTAHGGEQTVQFFDFTSAHLWNIAWREHWVTPSRHIYPFPFYASLLPLPYIVKLQAELLRELDAHPPAVILVSEESWPCYPGTIYHIIDSQAPWQAWFARHYTLLKQTTHYRVYARQG